MKTKFTNLLSLLDQNPTFLGELGTLQEIAKLIALLENGHWHDLEEIIKGSKLHKTQANKILEFLTNYNFIDLDSNRRKARVNSSLMKFLQEK